MLIPEARKKHAASGKAAPTGDNLGAATSIRMLAEKDPWPSQSWLSPISGPSTQAVENCASMKLASPLNCASSKLARPPNCDRLELSRPPNSAPTKLASPLKRASSNLARPPNRAYSNLVSPHTGKEVGVKLACRGDRCLLRAGGYPWPPDWPGANGFSPHGSRTGERLPVRRGTRSVPAPG